MTKSLALLAILFLSPGTHAFETLNFDCSVQSLPNTEVALNSETNRRIQKSVDRQSSCDRQNLLNDLRAEIADPWVNNLETWADRAPLTRCSVPANLSVYQDFTTIDSPIGIAAGLKSVINVSGVYIGTDKLSHFMTEGYEYFVAAEKGAGLRDLLERGMREENGIYGILTTGIRSYADMSANYQGYKFWSELLDGPNPYIQCSGGKWMTRRKFEWTDHINSSLDESINCNEYKTKNMQSSVNRRGAALRKVHGAFPETCPFQPLECDKLRVEALRTHTEHYLISPRCRSGDN